MRVATKQVVAKKRGIKWVYASKTMCLKVWYKWI